MFAPVKTIRVVVADDSAPIRQRLLALLGENKSLAVVGEAEDADSTLDTVEQLEPDALVLDLAMPGGGGLAVLRALRERVHPPVVVVLSNYATAEYRAECQALGAVAFLDKSTEFTRVGEVVVTAVASKRPALAASPSLSARHVQPLLDALPSAVILLDETGTIVAVNEAWRRFVATHVPNAGATIGARYMEVAPWRESPTRDEIMAGLVEVFLGRLPAFSHLYETSLHATPHWVRIRVLRFQPNGHLQVVVLEEDVTETQMALLAARDSEQSYRALFENAADGVFVLRLPDLRFIDVNRRVCEGAGYSREELLGRSAVELIPASALQERPLDLSLLKIGEPIVTERPIARRDGSEMTLEISVTLLPDGRMLGIARDVTTRRRVERALRASEAKFAKAFYANPSPMAILQLPDGVFVHVNDSFLRTFKFGREEVTGRTGLALGIWVHPSERDGVLRKLAAGRPVESEEHEFQARDGTSIVGLFSAEVIDLGGEPHVLALMQDLTKHRELEAQLRQVQKTEALGQLTGGIAHDLNNLLTIVGANAELLAAHFTDGREVPDELSELHDAVERARTLIKKLLAFGRRSTLRLVPLDLARVVSDVGGLLRRLVPENIDLSVTLPEEAVPVLGDANAIDQVLVNLVTNARDAVGDSGAVVIMVERCGLGDCLGSEAPHASVVVSDTGRGMDEATLQRVFEPFFTTKAVGEGTGLGLAMVHGLMKQHNGQITIQSAVGRGTTVRLCFPLHAGVIPASAPRRISVEMFPVTDGQETILLVEDEESLRRVGRRVLERAGYRVLVAPDGTEALEIWDVMKDRVDLVIADSVMPRMGGLTLYRELRARTPSVRFLLVSGYPQGVAEPSAEPLNADVPFLLKPWTTEELLEKVRDVIRRPDS
jgi:PAS domain S-box-containing protein